MSASETSKGCRIGIDVGGTFTDFVLSDPRTNRIVRFKESSVPEDPSRSVERGLPQLIERAGVNKNDIELIVHGTTLPLNAMIQRRGAKLGLVVSNGNRGILEIGRTQLSSAFSFLLDKETPLVPRNLVFGCSARIDSQGRTIAEATDAELQRAADAFKDNDVAAVVVLLVNSPKNPGFESGVAQRLATMLGDIPVTASAEIWPEDREFERSLVALINCYVQPIMTDYLDKLKARVEGLGITAPIYITSNNGGTLSLRTARERPIDTILSGPASGVVAASVVSRDTPFRNIATVDIGGTSADMSIIQNLQPSQSTNTHVGNLPLSVPVVAVSAIGAGGGSIVWVDDHGSMKVGPQSAGASPGPACYGRGGDKATLTDCYLIAGYIHEKHFLGGRLKLDRTASERALTAVADAMGFTGEDRAAKAADAAIRITTAMMSSEVSRSMARHGEDPSAYALVGFGGAGPTHANHLAADAGMASVIIPTAPSTFCALGAILSDVKRDFISSTFIDIDAGGAMTQLGEIFATLQTTAHTWIEPDLDLLGNVRYEATLDMRYKGQSFALGVLLPAEQLQSPDPARLLALFHAAHEKLYGYADPDSSAEIVAQRMRIISGMPPITMPLLISAPSAGVPIETRPVYLLDGYQTASVYRRDTLIEGQTIAGPAIIEQEDTTTVLLPAWTAQVDSHGNMILNRDRAA